MVCLETIKHSLLRYDQGMKKEKENIHYLMSTVQSKAQIYAFFSERNVQKWSVVDKFNYKTAKPMKVHKVGVVGLGTMGRGIVISLLTAGKMVYVLENSQEALKNGTTGIHLLIDGLKKRNLINESQQEMMKT